MEEEKVCRCLIHELMLSTRDEKPTSTENTDSARPDGRLKERGRRLEYRHRRRGDTTL